MGVKCWILLAIMLVFLVGCAQEPEAVEPNVTPIPDKTTAPSLTPVPQGVTILAKGAIQAVQPALPLAFENGGKLLAVHVQAGDLVRAGDLIATLEDTNAQDQVAQAELNLQLAELALQDLTDEVDPVAVAAAQANLSSAKANLTTLTKLTDDDLIIARADLKRVEATLKKAQTDYDRVSWLGGVEAMPQSVALEQATIDYERALASYRKVEEGPDREAVVAAEAQVEQAQVALDELLAGASTKDLATAEINVTQARLALESALRGLDNVELKSPASGTVTVVEAAPGALVGGGSPIVILLDTTQLAFHTTNLSERDLAQIVPGQTAVVTLKAYPDAPIEAVVERIGLQAGAAVGDAATFPVVLVLGNTDLDIRPGMTGRAEIRSEEGS